MTVFSYIDKSEVFVDASQFGHVIVIQHYLCGLHVLHYLLRNHCPGDHPQTTMEGKGNTDLYRRK